MLRYFSEILEVSIQVPITFVKAANVSLAATSIPTDKSCDITSSLERLINPKTHPFWRNIFYHGAKGNPKIYSP